MFAAVQETRIFLRIGKHPLSPALEGASPDTFRSTCVLPLQRFSPKLSADDDAKPTMARVYGSAGVSVWSDIPFKAILRFFIVPLYSSPFFSTVEKNRLLDMCLRNIIEHPVMNMHLASRLAAKTRRFCALNQAEQ